MQIALKLNLWRHKQDKAGLCPVAISMRGGGEEKYYNTGIKVLPDHWQEGTVTKGDKDNRYKNSKLQGLLSTANAQILAWDAQHTEYTIEDVKSLFNPTIKSGSFTKYYRAYIDNLINTNKKAAGTVALWESQYSQFVELQGDVAFSKINTAFLNAYHAKLASMRLGKDEQPYTGTTIHKKLKKLRQIVAMAVRDGLIDQKAVQGFEMIKYVEPETHYLTLEQAKQIADNLYTGKYDTQPQLRTATAFFLVEVFGGIRISDYRNFKIETLIAGRNFKVRAKKNNEYVYLDLSVFTSLDKILQYIHSEGLVYNLTDQSTNRLLKQVGIDIGLTFPLSSHDGRRTFATMLGEIGYSTRFIADAMGISEKTATRYIKVTGQSMNNEMALRGGF